VSHSEGSASRPYRAFTSCTQPCGPKIEKWWAAVLPAQEDLRLLEAGPDLVLETEPAGLQNIVD